MKNLVYATTLGKYQRVMRWWPVIKEFGPNIQHIYFHLHLLTKTIPAQWKLSVARTSYLLLVGRRKQRRFFPTKYLKCANRTTKITEEPKFQLSTYIFGSEIRYSREDLGKVEIICNDRRIYIPYNLRKLRLEWYHFYINHRVGSRLAIVIREVCYWKCLVTQARFMISRARYFNSSKRERLFVDICHLI